MTAIIENGILGTVTGKVGAVIAQRWKGKNIIKGYRKMKYPGYEAQVAQNDIFKFICDIGKVNYASLLKLTFLSGCVGQNFSPWNLLMKVNRGISNLLENKHLFQISFGELYPASIDYFKFTRPVNVVSVGWAEQISGNASPDDRIYIYVLFPGSNSLVLVSPENLKRSDAYISFTGQTQSYWTDAIVYIFAQNSNGLYSSTSGSKIVFINP